MWTQEFLMQGFRDVAVEEATVEALARQDSLELILSVFDGEVIEREEGSYFDSLTREEQAEEVSAFRRAGLEPPENLTRAIEEEVSMIEF